MHTALNLPAVTGWMLKSIVNIKVLVIYMFTGKSLFRKAYARSHWTTFQPCIVEAQEVQTASVNHLSIPVKILRQPAEVLWKLSQSNWTSLLVSRNNGWVFRLQKLLGRYSCLRIALYTARVRWPLCSATVVPWGVGYIYLYIYIWDCISTCSTYDVVNHDIVTIEYKF